MPIECTTEPSTMILLDLRHKLYIDLKKYCFVIRCLIIPGQVINPKGKTVDKDKTKVSNGLKTFTEIRLCKFIMENHASFVLLENCTRYFQFHFDPRITRCEVNISNTSKNYLQEQEKSRDVTARSSISNSLVSKIKPNLPISGIYNELKGIMVNNGQIHRESTGPGLLIFLIILTF